MTIEERAEEKFPTLHVPISGEGVVDTNEEYRTLYISAAKEQKEIDDKRYEIYLKEMSEELARSLASQRKVIIEKVYHALEKVLAKEMLDELVKTLKGERL